MGHPTPTVRDEVIARLSGNQVWDLAVIGGGATGLGIAVDAASRGHSVVLVEARDFAKGTSSRATKLLHGGVRYLAQGNFRLVYEALRERSVVLRNAPHLAQRLAFVIPVYRRFDQWMYGIALTAYGVLAGRRSLGRTEWLSKQETLSALPGVRRTGLLGGVRYWDAQFDDARLALALARTATAQGAAVLNYVAAIDLLHHANRVTGVVCRDEESGAICQVRARCVVNATGVWADGIRRRDSLSSEAKFKDRLQPSRGAHIVLAKSFLETDEALMVPKTSDGRVLFAIPWQGKLVAGTTDAPIFAPAADPAATGEEIDFILRELGQFLERQPTRADVLSTWAGLRPLVRPDSGALATKAISREHDILVSETGLVTVTGGKWTTYRVIARDVLETCFAHGLMTKKSDCQTATLPLVGCAEAVAGTYARYGSEGIAVQQLPGADTEICPGLTEAMVRFAARYEFARKVDDVLARRVRLLFLDARLAARCAARVAEILHEELGVDPDLPEFEQLASQYAGAVRPVVNSELMEAK